MNFNTAYSTLIRRVRNMESDLKQYPNGNLLEFLSSSPKETTPQDIMEQMDRVLDKGIVYNGEGTDSTYVLASVETYLRYAEAVGLTNGTELDYSVYAYVETYLRALESAGQPTREDNTFIPMVKKLLDSVGDEQADDRILDKGVMESGDFSLIPYLIKEGFGGDNVDRLLDKGIVISQINGVVCIASVETYLKLAEASGLIPAA